MAENNMECPQKLNRTINIPFTGYVFQRNEISIL